MGETSNTTTDKAPKKSRFKGLKSEFKKIIWPDKESLTKQSVAVVLVTLALGIFIYVLDFVINLGISQIM